MLKCIHTRAGIKWCSVTAGAGIRHLIVAGEDSVVPVNFLVYRQEKLSPVNDADNLNISKSNNLSLPLR